MQLLQHGHESVGVETRCRRQRNTQPVGFVFIVLIESLGIEVASQAYQLCRQGAAEIVVQLRADQLRDDAGAGILADGFQMVLLHHMADLMGQYAGELRLVGQAVDQAFGDEHVAAGCGKRVEAVVIENGEGPGQVGAAGLQADPASQLIDVALQLHVGMQGLAAQQNRGQLPADFHFLRRIDLRRRLRQQTDQIGRHRGIAGGFVGVAARQGVAKEIGRIEWLCGIDRQCRVHRQGRVDRYNCWHCILLLGLQQLLEQVQGSGRILALRENRHRGQHAASQRDGADSNRPPAVVAAAPEAARPFASQARLSRRTGAPALHPCAWPRPSLPPSGWVGCW